MIDIDIENTLPTPLLYRYAKAYFIKSPILEDLVSNREEFLSRIRVQDKSNWDTTKKNYCYFEFSCNKHYFK